MKLGLIAGNGRFPFLVLDAARAMGHEVTVVAVKEEAFARSRAGRGRRLPVPPSTGFLSASSAGAQDPQAGRRRPRP
jgi:hypothetical protein